MTKAPTQKQRRGRRFKLDSLAYALYQSAILVAEVLAGRSLTDAYGSMLDNHPHWSDAVRGAVRDHTWKTLRAYGRGDVILRELLKKPLPLELHALLLVALQRLADRPESAYVIVDQAVAAATEISAPLKGVINGVLRNYLRQAGHFQALIDTDEAACHGHPRWWLERLRRDYPDNWPKIVTAGNEHPPMSLRVNTRRTTVEAMIDRLHDYGIEVARLRNDALLLANPVPVSTLPGFAEGYLSVQDAGAQWAAKWLAPESGDRVLDACAAPGGKTAHLLETADIRLLALDIDAGRIGSVRSNLRRLGLNASTRVADARQVAQWWDGRPYDCILADVPCSGSGVVRRHPDIKWLRRDSDVSGFARQQGQILDALWQSLAPGGKMLYTTCSVFQEENLDQVVHFCQRHNDAERQPLDGQLHQQLLPCPEHDGFFYALLRKRG